MSSAIIRICNDTMALLWPRGVKYENGFVVLNVCSSVYLVLKLEKFEQSFVRKFYI